MWKNLNLICFGEKKAWLIPDEIIQTGIYKIPTLPSNAPVVFVVHTSWGFPKSLTILQKQQGSCCVHCFFLDSSLDKLNWNISAFSFPLVCTLRFQLFCASKLPTGILIIALLWQLKHSLISWHRNWPCQGPWAGPKLQPTEPLPVAASATSTLEAKHCPGF